MCVTVVTKFFAKLQTKQLGSCKYQLIAGLNQYPLQTPTTPYSPKLNWTQVLSSFFSYYTFHLSQLCKHLKPVHIFWNHPVHDQGNALTKSKFDASKGWGYRYYVWRLNYLVSEIIPPHPHVAMGFTLQPYILLVNELVLLMSSAVFRELFD